MAEDWEKDQNKYAATAENHYREDVVNNPDYFDAATGKLKWEENAPNDGAIEGTKEQVELLPGDKLVRYDTLDGSYIAPADTKYEELSLPYDESKIEKTYWEVDKPFIVEKSEVAPAFGSEGGGTQYRLNSSDDRVSDYNNEHNKDGEIVPKDSFKDSPSNLAFEGFVHQISEQETLGENNQTSKENETMGVRDMLKGMGHEASPPSEQTQEKYSESENQSPTHIRDMLQGKEPEEQAPKIENENENE